MMPRSISGRSANRICLADRDRQVDRLRHPRQTVEVHRRHRILVEQQAVALQAPAQRDRVGRRLPRSASGVDHQVDLRPVLAAQPPDAAHRVPPAEELHRGEAPVDQLARPLLVEGVAVEADADAHLAAQQVPDRPVQRLALQVPERQLDAGDGARADHAGHAVALRGGVQLLPDPLDQERVLAHDQQLQVLDRGLHDPRPAPALADTVEPGVGMDLHEQPVAPAGPFGRAAGNQERADVGDAHGQSLHGEAEARSLGGCPAPDNHAEMDSLPAARCAAPDDLLRRRRTEPSTPVPMHCAAILGEWVRIDMLTRFRRGQTRACPVSHCS